MLDFPEFGSYFVSYIHSCFAEITLKLSDKLCLIWEQITKLQDLVQKEKENIYENPEVYVGQEGFKKDVLFFKSKDMVFREGPRFWGALRGALPKRLFEKWEVSRFSADIIQGILQRPFKNWGPPRGAPQAAFFNEFIRYFLMSFGGLRSW